MYCTCRAELGLGLRHFLVMSCSWLLISLALAVCVEARSVPEAQVVHVHRTTAAENGYATTEWTRTVRDINECAEGSHDCHKFASCTNTARGYYCQCDRGFTGNGHQCEDINECSKGLDDCHDKDDCKNTEGGFTCISMSPVVVGVYSIVMAAVVLAIIAVFIMTTIFRCRKRYRTLIGGHNNAAHMTRLQNTSDEDLKPTSGATSSAVFSNAESCILEKQETTAANKASSGTHSSATSLERNKHEVLKKKEVDSHPVMVMQPDSEPPQHYEQIDTAYISGDNIYAEPGPATAESDPPHHYEAVDTSHMRRDSDYADLCSATLDIGVTDNVAYGVGRVF